MKRVLRQTSIVTFTLLTLLLTPLACIREANAAAYVKSISQTIELQPAMQYELTFRMKKSSQATTTVSLEEVTEDANVILMYDTEYKVLTNDSADGKDSLSSSFEKGNNTIYITNTSNEPIQLVIQINSKSALLKYISSEIKSDEI